MTDPMHLLFCKIHLIQDVKITLYDLCRFNTSAAGPIRTKGQSVNAKLPQNPVCLFNSVSGNKVRKNCGDVKMNIQIDSIFPLETSEMANNDFQSGMPVQPVLNSFRSAIVIPVLLS